MKIFLSLLILQSLLLTNVHAQEKRFTAELDKFCRSAIKDFHTIRAERKVILNDMAQQLSKKRYVVFTCRTNSRRTQLLQVWAQTAFFYYDLYDKHAFSLGDTVTTVYPGVRDVLAESGFYCTTMLPGEPNKLVVCINKDYPEDILSSKKNVGTIDTAKGILISICSEDEQMGVTANKTHISLPYHSPTLFENTPQEKQKYEELNRQIAVEMLYIGHRIYQIFLKENEIRY